MDSKKVISHGLMLIGMMHLPFALYLGFSRGMGPEMALFAMGVVLFWSGYFLHRNFGG